MIENDKFKFEVTKRGIENVVLLIGIIDEDTILDDILAIDSPIVFNFSKVTSINSCGIRNWVNFIKNLKDKNVFFEECPPIIVRQMNMVPSFKQHAKVMSVFVPYVCDTCEAEKLVLVGEKEMERVEEALPCDNCEHGEMELDGQKEQYFAFAK